MQVIVPALTAEHDIFTKNREKIIRQWVSYEGPKNILILHGIEEKFFLNKYASGVFDYFMDIIKGKVEIGHCPVMQELLTYLKKREISADELFEICSHFRRSMIDFSYDAKLNSKKLFDEISFIFDKNFKGILKFYTDTIFQKLIDARQDALKASQAKEYFLSNMSHEIRTPLNAILGFVNLLLEEEISKKHRNYLDIIHNSGENLLSIINDILDFSKLRSGEFTLENKNFSLHEELSHTMELFVASANAKDITITSFIDPNIPIELYGDSLRIKQILSNFLSNAIKFTSESGVLKVEASYTNSTLLVSVEDSGIGICQEDIKKIFKAFAQAEYNIKENKGGTGLGLSISHQLAQKMGGEVGVESEVDVGSKFWMRIPISTVSEQTRFFDDIDEFKKLKMIIYAQENKVNYKNESYLKYAEMFEMDIRVVDSLETEFDICIFVHEDSNKAFLEKIKTIDKKFLALMSKEYDDYEQCSHITALSFPIYCSKIYTAFHELLNPEEYSEFKTTVSQKYKGHLLVAEDNEANQELIKIILSKYGLSFDIANNGLEAFNLYKKNKYDLILMDEQMPVMNGNEAVEHIREHEDSKSISHTPISALTANVVKGARERGLLRGFDAFLGKPVVLKELEKLFFTYLKVDNEKQIQEIQEQKKERVQVVGLDTKKLMKALMLSSDELLMLLKLFMKKMDKIFPELQKAIQDREYKKIGMIAHSIKGSSGNFRMKEVQELSSQMESMAREENKSYDYCDTYKEIEKIINSINIE
jgi:CheY-like chemotaxis protein/nitrogen-specific signal transduction histidine kinase